LVGLGFGLTLFVRGFMMDLFNGLGESPICTGLSLMIITSFQLSKRTLQGCAFCFGQVSKYLA